MFRLRQKVKILSSKKTDGSFNYGKIVGIRLLENRACLSYKTEREFMSRFDGKYIEYTVAYIDCVTKRANVEKFFQHELSKQ